MIELDAIDYATIEATIFSLAVIAFFYFKDNKPYI